MSVGHAGGGHDLILYNKVNIFKLKSNWNTFLVFIMYIGPQSELIT